MLLLLLQGYLSRFSWEHQENACHSDAAAGGGHGYAIQMKPLWWKCTRSPSIIIPSPPSHMPTRPQVACFFLFFSSFFLRIQRKPPYHTMPLPPLLPPHLASLVSWHNRHYVYGYYHYCGSNCLPRSFAITRLEKKERMKKKTWSS